MLAPKAAVSLQQPSKSLKSESLSNIKTYKRKKPSKTLVSSFRDFEKHNSALSQMRRLW